MKIEKEYDVQELANKVKEKIENCGKCGTKSVGLNVLTAQEIVDVLETVASWENKRTKLRDIREEVLKQNCFGTYDDDDIECQCCDSKKGCKKKKEVSDISEEEKEKCFGKKRTLCDDCLMRYCCNADCTNEHITKQMLGDLEECFGKSYCKRPTFVCMNCKYKEQCKEITKHE